MRAILAFAPLLLSGCITCGQHGREHGAVVARSYHTKRFCEATVSSFEDYGRAHFNMCFHERQPLDYCTSMFVSPSGTRAIYAVHAKGILYFDEASGQQRVLKEDFGKQIDAVEWDEAGNRATVHWTGQPETLVLDLPVSP